MEVTGTGNLGKEKDWINLVPVIMAVPNSNLSNTLSESEAVVVSKDLQSVLNKAAG